MKIAIAGSSGFVGTWLKKSFNDVVEVKRAHFENNDFSVLQNCDVLINLCGAPIIQRWSEKTKKQILSSRLDTTRQLVKAMQNTSIKHFISTSAVGYYEEDKEFDEYNAINSNDFLGCVTKQWEDEAFKTDIPTTVLRLGIVLDKKGGALQKMFTPFSLGLGGNIGNGQAWFSWIDLADLVCIFHYIIDQKLMGIINATSPNPVKNEEFTKTLGKILEKPTFFTVPEIALKLIYSEGSIALTSSKRVLPKRLIEAGFEFKYGSLEESLKRTINGEF